MFTHKLQITRQHFYLTCVEISVLLQVAAILLLVLLQLKESSLLQILKDDFEGQFNILFYLGMVFWRNIYSVVPKSSVVLVL
jgi:hypothetical protein